MEKTPRILIVDDEPTARETLADLLALQEYTLGFAANGQETLACMVEFQPDLVLLDVMMPHMDGYEVCRRLKADKKWLNVPVILVTALDGRDDLVRGLDAGADEFLSKPVNGAELRARVRSMLRIKKAYDDLFSTLKLREELADMIVHDMKNLLNTISHYTELLLLRDTLQPAETEMVNGINLQLHRLDTFANDILLVAKMEENRLILHRTKVDVNQLVKNVQSNHRVVAESKQIGMVADLPADSKPMPLDKNLFSRVLDNLLSNALKFSPAESAVTIRVAYSDNNSSGPESAALCLQVIDNGPGVPANQHDKIFDKFKIIDLKKKGISQIGLGLAFCKMVVEAHGGRIYVTDNEPQGAIFNIEI